MREVSATLESVKPLILVIERDAHRGGWTPQEAREQCPEFLRSAIFGPPEMPRQLIPWMR